MMVMLRQSRIVSIALSVFIHAMIIVSLFINFKLTAAIHYIVPGKVTMVYLQTRLAPVNHHPHKVIVAQFHAMLPQPKKPAAKVQHIYSEAPHVVAMSRDKAVAPGEKPKTIQHALTIVKNHPSQNGMADHNQHQLPEKKISGEKLNQLVVYLYKIISQHKVYPEMARELVEQGQVLVAFTLAPSGQISQLHIAHSSGYHRLDRAALETIRSSVPFVDAGRYLHQSQKLTLPVVYD